MAKEILIYRIRNACRRCSLQHLWTPFKMGTNKKAPRFGVGSNRPLRLSGMTSGIIGVARGRNISEHLPCNALTCQATYQNRSLNWLNCRCPREKPPRSDIFGRPMKPSTAVENLSFFAHFFPIFPREIESLSNYCLLKTIL